MTGISIQRIQQELKSFNQNPPHGISFWPVAGQMNNLEAIIEGPEESPFEGGEFRLSITIPDNYPFVPPIMKFKTKIYHPNIDSSGRICLDTLKPNPQGSWKPSINISTLLMQIQILMSYPNPSDPLDADIASLYTQNIEKYKEKAKQMTLEYAKPYVTNESNPPDQINDEEESDEE